MHNIFNIKQKRVDESIGWSVKISFYVFIPITWKLGKHSRYVRSIWVKSIMHSEFKWDSIFSINSLPWALWLLRCMSKLSNLYKLSTSGVRRISANATWSKSNSSKSNLNFSWRFATLCLFKEIIDSVWIFLALKNWFGFHQNHNVCYPYHVQLVCVCLNGFIHFRRYWTMLKILPLENTDN